MSIWA